MCRQTITLLICAYIPFQIYLNISMKACKRAIMLEYDQVNLSERKYKQQACKYVSMCVIGAWFHASITPCEYTSKQEWKQEWKHACSHTLLQKKYNH